MNNILKNKVKKLIEVGTEGGYWDFKEKWTSEGKLLKSIICLANNTTLEDGLLIFGVNDKLTVVGIETDSGRKDLKGITQFIASKKFAYQIPEVFLETINLDEHEIDVLIIKNTNKTPYYLEKKYGNVEQGVIYSRLNDTNTGSKEYPTSNQMIEVLWQKRFGINLSISERLDFLLDEYESWGVYTTGYFRRWEQGGDFGNLDYIYHKKFPEFRIELLKEGKHELKLEGFCSYYYNEKYTVYEARVYYHSTILREFQILAVDELRKYIINPLMSSFRNEVVSQHWPRCDGRVHFYYVCLDEIDGKILKILTNGTLDVSSRYPNANWLLIFESQGELEKFISFAENNQELFSKDIKSTGILSEENEAMLSTPSKVLNQAHSFYLKWKDGYCRVQQ